MALVQCDFFSDVLGLSCSMNVVLPQKTTKQVGMEGTSTTGATPVLYLLHGWSDDHTIWLRRTSVERYAAPLGLAVVMPAVMKSSYTNMKFGLRYWDFISEEVPALARQFFGLSDAREDNFVAGLSMGGYGAMKMLLNHPERFAAGGTFSGSVGPKEEYAKRDGERHLIYGDDVVKGTNSDLFWLAEQIVERGAPKPPIFQTCGTEDGLIDANRKFSAHVEKLGFEVAADFRPGTHEWGFWDADIASFLDWIKPRLIGGDVE